MPNDGPVDASIREQTRTENETDASRREHLTPGPDSLDNPPFKNENVHTRTDAYRRERARNPAPENWIVIDRALERFAEAGLPIKVRTLQKYCLRQKIRSRLADTDKNTVKYFLDPTSLEEFIAREKQKVPTENGEPEVLRTAEAPMRVQTRTEGESDAYRRERVRDDFDVYEHPYVKRLEAQVEKAEAKYEAQVRRTEEIQMHSQEKILELQRMTTIGQSKTLAEFMLDAKEWILGAGKAPQSREVTDPGAS